MQGLPHPDRGRGERQAAALLSPSWSSWGMGWCRGARRRDLLSIVISSPAWIMLIDASKRMAILPADIVACDARRRDRGKRRGDQATIRPWPNDPAAASSGACRFGVLVVAEVGVGEEAAGL